MCKTWLLFDFLGQECTISSARRLVSKSQCLWITCIINIFLGKWSSGSTQNYQCRSLCSTLPTSTTTLVWLFHNAWLYQMETNFIVSRIQRITTRRYVAKKLVSKNYLVAPPPAVSKSVFSSFQSLDSAESHEEEAKSTLHIKLSDPEQRIRRLDFTKWTAKDVQLWIETIHFGDGTTIASLYGTQFVQNDVDGKMLDELTENVIWFDLGIQSKEKRHRFMEELEILKINRSNSICYVVIFVSYSLHQLWGTQIVLQIGEHISELLEATQGYTWWSQGTNKCW